MQQGKEIERQYKETATERVGNAELPTENGKPRLRHNRAIEFGASAGFRRQDFQERRGFKRRSVSSSLLLRQPYPGASRGQPVLRKTTLVTASRTALLALMLGACIL